MHIGQLIGLIGLIHTNGANETTSKNPSIIANYYDDIFVNISLNFNKNDIIFPKKKRKRNDTNKLISKHINQPIGKGNEIKVKIPFITTTTTSTDMNRGETDQIME